MNFENDGIDHINIYSKGKTEIGRRLSNFAFAPFTLPEEGRFASIECYWYWLLLQSLDKSLYSVAVKRAEEELRPLSGFGAKKLGRELLPKGFLYAPELQLEFRNKIKNAFCAKLNYHPEIKELLRESILPFAHYYVFNGKVINSSSHNWQVVFWEKMRTKLKNQWSFNV